MRANNSVIRKDLKKKEKIKATEQLNKRTNTNEKANAFLCITKKFSLEKAKACIYICVCVQTHIYILFFFTAEQNPFDTGTRFFQGETLYPKERQERTEKPSFLTLIFSRLREKVKDKTVIRAEAKR